MFSTRRARKRGSIRVVPNVQELDVTLPKGVVGAVSAVHLGGCKRRT